MYCHVTEAHTTQWRKVKEERVLASGNDDSCGNNSGAKRKTKSSGTIVKSRYMQTEKKSVVKKLSLNESVIVPPRAAPPKMDSGHRSRLGNPPRQTLHSQSEQNSVLIPSLLESSSLSGNVLQSTVLDGHCMRPDFDLSVIKGNAATSALPSSADSNAKNRNLELETFLLAFLTAKIENNTQKLKDEAERNLITLMDEEEKLRLKIINKKQQYLQLKKQQQLNDLLELQVVTLTPVAETAKQFTDEYKTFAAAIDAARHELPVRNLHIEEDREKFLNKAAVCLNQSQRILEEYMKDVSKESDRNAACLKEIESTAHQIYQCLPSASSDLLDLSSLLYDPYINDMHLQECLSWLMECYSPSACSTTWHEEMAGSILTLLWPMIITKKDEKIHGLKKHDIQFIEDLINGKEHSSSPKQADKAEEVEKEAVKKWLQSIPSEAEHKDFRVREEKIDKKHEELKRNVLKELTILEKKRNAADGWNRPSLTEQLWEIELERRKRVKQEERMTKIYQEEEDRQQRLEAGKWKIKKEERKQEDKEENDEIVLIDYLRFSEKKKCKNEREKSYWIKEMNKKMMKGRETMKKRIYEEQPKIHYNTHRVFEAEEQGLEEKRREKEKERELEEHKKEIERLRDLDKRMKIERQKTLKEKWQEKERLRGIEEKRKEEERLRVCEEKRKEEEKKRSLAKERKEKERKSVLEERRKEKERLREVEQKQLEEIRLRTLQTKKRKAEMKRVLWEKGGEEERRRKLEETMKDEETQRKFEEQWKKEEKQRELKKKWIQGERLRALKNIKTEMQEKKKEQRRQQNGEEINSIITFSEKEKQQNKREQETEKIVKKNPRIKEEGIDQ
ncbi:HAUS augmin-like complex subunit 8 [Bagarius yarrelli]|uniref:HAUS augmin-like complex subunit 8 n=1 Tax=Bagarius yarrelli TaxID=175774 RepID=A0A556VVS2_BAGYA|nr:HAUS augmin-like complex subunit 8 [Bagarius yarrelli]